MHNCGDEADPRLTFAKKKRTWIPHSSPRRCQVYVVLQVFWLPSIARLPINQDSGIYPNWAILYQRLQQRDCPGLTPDSLLIRNGKIRVGTKQVQRYKKIRLSLLWSEFIDQIPKFWKLLILFHIHISKDSVNIVRIENQTAYNKAIIFFMFIKVL